jgi:hypothetical protein
MSEAIKPIENESAVTEFLELAEKSALCSTLVSLVLSSPNGGDVLKIRGTLKLISGKKTVQLELHCTEGRMRHINAEPVKLCEILSPYAGIVFKRGEVTDKDGSAILMLSKKNKATLITKGMLKSKPLKNDETVLSEGNDRAKNHILTGDEEFLRYLGVSDKNGRVHDKMRPKFRQINRFCEQIRDIVKYLPKEGVIRCADLCCGKSYLSFAAYHYLSNILGREIDMTCIDLKESVIDYCAQSAKSLRFDGMHFICDNIANYNPSKPPHLVISLHACDTATDIVLDCASSNRAKVILSTPCCHHELFRKMNCPTLGFIEERSILKQKFCDAATDSMRLLRLEAMGYRTDAIELIDPEETPKNVLLRGILTGDYNEKKADEYRAAYKFLTGTAPKELPTMKH